MNTGDHSVSQAREPEAAPPNDQRSGDGGGVEGVRQADRWSRFSDEELCCLWEELTRDDGSRYGVEPDDEPLFSLVGGLYAAARSRGLVLPDGWAVGFSS